MGWHLADGAYGPVMVLDNPIADILGDGPTSDSSAQLNWNPPPSNYTPPSTPPSSNPPPSNPAPSNPQTRQELAGGANVGDIRGNQRWNGVNWEDLGGGGGGPSPQEIAMQAARKAQEEADARARGEITAGYDTYFASLDKMMSEGLPAQQTAQLGIAQSQGTQAENTLGAQKTQGLADLSTYGRQVDTNQVKTLQDLSENMRALFRSGQVQIGAKGAGDSSAVNQYAYALSKEGNKSRGNVLSQTTELRNQIHDKEFKLKNTYNTELANIKEQVAQKTQSIAQWFAEQQNALTLAKGQGAIQKGESLANLSKQALTQAMNEVTALQTEASNRRLLLEQWAANNTATIGQLKNDMAGITQGQNTGVSSPGMPGLDGQTVGASGTRDMTPYGFSATGSQDDTAKQYPWLNNTQGVTWG